MTIDQLIAAHWGDCDVGREETPEAYATRHEESQMIYCGWDGGLTQPAMVWVRHGRAIELLRTEGGA